MESISEEDLCALILVVKKIGAKLKERLGILGYNIIENNDAISGQVVPHVHFHIVPRIEGDNLLQWPGQEYKEGEAEEILKKLQ